MVLPFPPAPPGGVPGMPPQVNPLDLFSFIPQQLLDPNPPQPLSGAAQAQIPPPPDDILELADQAKTLWQARDTRMDEDEDLYNMVEADQNPDEIVRNTPQVVVDKVSNMVGAHVPVIDVITSDDKLSAQAQKQKSFIHWMWDEWDREWRRGAHPSIRQNGVFFEALRGWLTGRVFYDPNAAPDTPPVKLELIDPRNVYIQPGTRDLVYVVHRQFMFVSEVRDEWPEPAQAQIGDRPGTDTVEVIAYYDRYYYAVYADGQEMVPATPHNYGFLPWVVVVPGGSPVRATSRTSGGTNWTKNVGPSLFNATKNAYKAQNKVLTILYDSVERSVEPPVAVSYKPETGKPEEVSLAAGATNYMIQGNDDLHVINTAPPAAAVSAILATLNDDVFMGSIPKVLWGGADPSQSGLAIALLSGAARDALFGVIKGMEFFTEEVNRMALTLIRDLHTQPVGFVVKDAQGNWIANQAITPQEIGEVGVRTKVHYKDLSPKDQFQQMQMALALSKDKLISMQTARAEYLGIEDPARENTRIIDELMYNDPEIMKNFIFPISLYQSNPNLFNLWVAYQQFQQQQQAQQTGSQTGGQGNAPPVGSLPGVPGMPGSPPTLLPAQMGTNPFNAREHALASAQGGAGQQNQPGVPGIGGVIPGGLGVR